MNTANLQLEGLCLAIAAINRALVAKGLLSEQELTGALRAAEAAAKADDRFDEKLSPANRDAICFPIRVLQLANSAPEDSLPSFSQLARAVGETKPAYNDQQ